ncbi:YbaK/prolyl-tRNA synthetase associated region [Dethiosulfovibrio peptidovorans DSM 11002]|uniref:YbaK/prolyl-tRNA synthetase associated region n=1 Tax=Dethiosulfovibrio peptidovorans DSM 11002 TaxID=469381 RepID=D2Z8R4_9BACT|nr:YbaK/EbsC family protein [Dethiosulfovibrio peptidovorans]EFC91861.1 YbaK/prolyl-tRNA synthetase associated region [Dethiosulfovibrio peptidovorans DSM 11002]
MENEAVKKVRSFLDSKGYDGTIYHTDDTIFTVEDASRAVGAPPEEILKSLVFMVSGDPVLVLMSGDNRVDPKRIASVMGTANSKVKMAQPDYVYSNFGYKVGGVPPVGYRPSLPALVDEELSRFDVVWAAAGTDHDFFPISPELLLEYTEGRMVSLKK